MQISFKTTCLITLLVFFFAPAQASTQNDKSATVERISNDLLASLRDSRQPKPVPVAPTPIAELQLENTMESVTVLPLEELQVTSTPQDTEAHRPAPRILRPNVPAPPIGLATRRGFDVGAHVSRYKYHEVVDGAPFMNTKGDKIGAEVAYTHGLDNNWFLRGEGRLTYGTVVYSGSGTSKNNHDFIREVRGLVGKDYIFNNFGLSVYSGYATRFLYNDIRGLSSSGAAGYRRESYYEYVPLGVTHRFKVNDQGRLATTFEYDFFTKGEQRSVLGDADPAFSTLENDQGAGYFSARGSLLYETATWSLGPWIDYWHIRDSKVNCIPGLCGLEPENKTTEVGFKIVKKLY